MNIKINVEPAKLLSCAARIESQAEMYEKGYHLLYQHVDTMAAGWRGKDNMAFTTQIKSFTSDFEQMSILMHQYAEFLRQSASIYQRTQEERTQMARRLMG